MKDRNTILVLVLLLLIAAGWLFQIGHTIENSFLTNDFYRKLFRQVDLTPYAREMMMEEFVKSMPVTIPENIMNIIVNELSSVYDRAWLEKELLVIIDDLILFVKGKQQPPPLHLNLTEKNEQIRELIKEALLQKQRESFFVALFNSAVVDQSIASLVNNIPLPAYFDLNEYFAEKEITDDIIGSVKKFKSFRGYSLYLPYLIGALCFVAFFIQTGLVRTFKWFASGIVISGAFYILAMMARRPLFLNSMEKSMKADGISEFAAIIKAIELAIETSLHIPVFFILFGLVLFLAGLLLDTFILNPGGGSDRYEDANWD